MNVNYMKLEEIANVSAGGTPKRSETSYWKNGNIPWVKISDIKSKYVNQTEEFITEKGLNNSSAKLFPKGTILYTIFATLGECAILEIDAATNQAIAGINITTEKVLNDYLYYYLKSIKKKIINKGRGVAQNNINLKILKNIIVPVPDIETQKKIIKVLDITENVILKRQQQIEALSELKTSIFLDMFGDPFINPYNWKVTTLKEIADIIMGQSPPGTSYNTVKKGVPLLNGPTEFSELYPIEKQWTTEPKRLSAEGDILFCVRGATAGRLNLSDKEYAIGRGLAAIRPKKIEDTNFIYLVLDFMYDYFQKTSDGSTFININKKTLENITIFIVPTIMKEKYNDISSNIELNLKKIKSSLIKLESLYESILHKAFSGELFKEESINV